MKSGLTQHVKRQIDLRADLTVTVTQTMLILSKSLQEVQQQLTAMKERSMYNNREHHPLELRA